MRTGYLRALSITQAGTGFRSRTKPSTAINFKTYQVRSISHQRKPCRAEPGKK